jgi:hypothetical protein
MAEAMLRHTHPVPLAQGLFLVPILAATFDELRERFPDVTDPVEIMPATKAEAGPINAALRSLGVKAQPPHDELDSVGLGAYRHNEDWLGLEAD